MSRFRDMHESYVKNRFYAKVLIPNDNGCMLWTGATHNAGYGVFSLYKGELVKAHRYSYEMHKGKIHSESYILHSCDNPACVAPDHLREGSQLENIHDAINRNRHSSPPVFHGEKNKSAKLTDEKIREIRLHLVNGLSTYKIADMYGVTRPMIGYIKNGKNWKHVL